MGTEADVQDATYRGWTRYRSADELERELQQSDLAYREVFQPADDMFRNGFVLEDVRPGGLTLDMAALQSAVQGNMDVTSEGQIERDMGLLYYAARLVGLGNGLGGAVLVPLLDDGLDPVMPLDVRRIRGIAGWRVFDRREITPLTNGSDRPEYYMLTGLQASELGSIWHASRVWANEGLVISDYQLRWNMWWGLSVLEQSRIARVGAESALKSLGSYIHRVSWLAYYIAELDDLLRETDADGNEIGMAAVERKAATMRQMISTHGVVVLDAGAEARTSEAGEYTLPARRSDKMESVIEKITGLPEIYRAFLDRWQIASKMPRSIAFGEGAPGFGDGENRGDWYTWEGIIAAMRKDVGTPLMTWMLMLLFASKSGPTHGVIPEHFTIRWNRLVEPTALERAEEEKAVAEADDIRLKQKTIFPDEVRDQRFVKGDVSGHLRATERVAEEEQTSEILVGTAQTMMTGSTLVTAGQMMPEAYAQLLPIISNGGVTAEDARAISQASVSTVAAQPLGGAPEGTAAAAPALSAGPVPAPTPAPGVAVEPAVDEPEDETLEDADVPTFTMDTPPSGGLAKARAIKQQLREMGFGSVTVQQIKKLARSGEIRAWNTLGSEPEFAIADVLGVLQARNVKPVSDAQNPDLATIYGWLIEHYTHARKLSATRIETLLRLRGEHAFLRAPDQPLLYRGLYNVSPAKAGRLVGPTNPTLDKSWTTDRSMAARFARGEFIDAQYLDASSLGVVMEAAPKVDVVLLDASAIADIPEVGGFYNQLWGMTLAESIREEAEVIVFGSLDVTRIEVVKAAQDEAQLDDFAEDEVLALALDDADAWSEERLDATPEDRIAEAFKRYHETVNMGANELREWAASPWSSKASLSRAPIKRNLTLLETPRDKWTLAHARSAMQTVSFVARMRGNEDGPPVKIGGREGPSKRVISLRNWAFDPSA